MMAHPPQNGSRGASGPIYPSAGVSSSQVQITHPYPSRLDTRSKVVEILSAAANGCLAELGYDPYRVAQLEQTANEWQKENVQLYADNTQLLQQLRWLKEQLALSPNEALKQLVQARNDNAALLKERDALLRRLADLEKQQPTGPTYRQLHSEYMKVLHSKNLLEANIRQLRNQIQQDRTMPRQTQPITSGGAPLPHHPGTLVVQNPVQTSSTSSTRRPRPVSQPVAHPNAVPQEVRVAPPRPQGRNSAESMSSATPQHSPPLTTQFLSYQPIAGYPPLWTGAYAAQRSNPGPHPPSQNGDRIVQPQASAPPAAPPTWALPPSRSNAPSPFSIPSPTLNVGPSNPANISPPAPLPGSSVSMSNVARAATLPMNPSTSTSNTPPQTSNAETAPPPKPAKVVSLPMDSRMASTSPGPTSSAAAQQGLDLTPSKRLSMSSAMANITITPQPPKPLELAPSEAPASHSASSPPNLINTPAASSPSADLNRHRASPTDKGGFTAGSTGMALDVPKRNISEVGSPHVAPSGQSKRPRLSTEMNVDDDILDVPVTMSPLALTVDYGSAVLQEPPLLDLTAQAQGEPALQAQGNSTAVDTSPGAQLAQTPRASAESPERLPDGTENVEMEGVEQGGVSAGPSAEVPNPTDEDEDEEESEEWELGPDGLRLPSDVVESLYAEREDGARRCQLCMLRFMKGITMDGVPSEEPPWLLDTPEEDRIAHCIDKHLDVWNNVRAGRGQ